MALTFPLGCVRKRHRALLNDALGNSRLGLTGFSGAGFIRHLNPALVARVMLILRVSSQGE